jgi:hypothetical protein
MSSRVAPIAWLQLRLGEGALDDGREVLQVDPVDLPQAL